MVSKAYNPVIDGLRACAILMVVFYHLDPKWLPGGFHGVDIFFAISGYLITAIILRQIFQGGFSLSGFYSRRVARIFPVYFLVAAATLFFSWLFYGQRDFSSTGALAVSSAVFATNLKLMAQGSYFEIQPDTQPFLHFWSLAVEEQFYMVFPGILVLLGKFRNPRKVMLRTIILMALGSFGLCLFLYFYKPVWSFFLFPTRAWQLMAGSILAVVHEGSRGENHIEESRAGAWQCAGVFLFLASALLPGIRPGSHFEPWVAGLPVIGTLIFIHFSHCTGFLNQFLACKVMVYGGLVSYSLYMWHWPVFCFVDYKWFDSSDSFRLLLKLGICIPVSVVSYHFFEKPVRDWLNRRKRHGMTWGLLMGGIAVLLGVGTVVRYANHVGDPSLEEVRRGGVVINGQIADRSVALVGDSIASMYTTALRDFAEEQGFKLRILSAHSHSPVPGSELWEATIQALQRDKPDVVIFSAAWESHFKDNEAMVRKALEDLLSVCPRVFVLSNPPILPKEASRQNIRSHGMKPFFESSENASNRAKATAVLLQMQNERVSFIDISDFCQNPDGSFKFFTSQGKFLYRDSTHIDTEASLEVMNQLIWPGLSEFFNTAP